MESRLRWLFNQLWERDKDKLTWYALLKQAEEMELDSTNVERLEVINHAKNNLEIGRVLTLHQGKDFEVVDVEFQDGGKTLKIFLS